LCLPVCLLNATNYHAVCVGIADYSGTAYDVPNNTTVHDAEDMRSYLITYQGWSSGNIVVRLNNYATESNICSDISNMPNSLGNSELFLFSGHGSEDYGLVTYSTNNFISPNELTSSFDNSFYQYCCFINACHSGIFVNQMSKGEISSACKSDEMAWTIVPDNNCVYSYYILEGIRNNQADPTSGHVVSAREVHDYARPYITSDMPTMHPQFKGNLGVLNLSTLGPTTSGSLIDDELWDQNVTITNNVTVPSDVILCITSGVTINLNGHHIISTGGSIIVQSGATINGLRATIPNTVSPYKGLFSSIQVACNYSYLGTIRLLSGSSQDAININNPPGNVTIYGDAIGGT